MKTFNDFRNESGLIFTDISSEAQRTYDYGTCQIVIDKPIALHVSKNGGHRLFSADGTSHYVQKGWKHLSWIVFSDQPHFVK